MSRSLTERRLFDLAQRLKRARDELAVVDEQVQALSESADEARLRSLVSETPLAHREYTDAQRHADAMSHSRDALAASIAELQHSQDRLLDKLVLGAGPE